MLPAWRVLPEPVRDFVAQLLTVDPKERLTADAALEHPWLARDVVSATSSRTNSSTHLPMLLGSGGGGGNASPSAVTSRRATSTAPLSRKSSSNTTAL